MAIWGFDSFQGMCKMIVLEKIEEFEENRKCCLIFY